MPFFYEIKNHIVTLKKQIVSMVRKLTTSWRYQKSNIITRAKNNSKSIENSLKLLSFHFLSKNILHIYL